MLPVLIGLWKLDAAHIGTLIAIGYLGQVIGSIFFGWLAERIGRVPCTIYTLLLFSVMSFVCAFAWDLQSLARMRFVQGIGLGGEIPIMATYIGEFASLEAPRPICARLSAAVHDRLAVRRTWPASGSFRHSGGSGCSLSARCPR